MSIRSRDTLTGNRGRKPTGCGRQMGDETRSIPHLHRLPGYRALNLGAFFESSRDGSIQLFWLALHSKGRKITCQPSFLKRGMHGLEARKGASPASSDRQDRQGKQRSNHLFRGVACTLHKHAPTHVSLSLYISLYLSLSVLCLSHTHSIFLYPSPPSLRLLEDG